MGARGENKMEEGLSTPYSPREESGGRQDAGTHSRAGGSMVRRGDDAWGAGKPGNLRGWETG